MKHLLEPKTNLKAPSSLFHTHPFSFLPDSLFPGQSPVCCNPAPTPPLTVIYLDDVTHGLAAARSSKDVSLCILPPSLLKVLSESSSFFKHQFSLLGASPGASAGLNASLNWVSSDTVLSRHPTRDIVPRLLLMNLSSPQPVKDAASFTFVCTVTEYRKWFDKHLLIKK